MLLIGIFGKFTAFLFRNSICLNECAKQSDSGSWPSIVQLCRPVSRVPLNTPREKGGQQLCTSVGSCKAGLSWHLRAESFTINLLFLNNIKLPLAPLITVFFTES